MLYPENQGKAVPTVRMVPKDIWPIAWKVCFLDNYWSESVIALAASRWSKVPACIDRRLKVIVASSATLRENKNVRRSDRNIESSCISSMALVEVERNSDHRDGL